MSQWILSVVSAKWPDTDVITEEIVRNSMNRLVLSENCQSCGKLQTESSVFIIILFKIPFILLFHSIILIVDSSKHTQNKNEEINMNIKVIIKSNIIVCIQCVFVIFPLIFFLLFKTLIASIPFLSYYLHCILWIPNAHDDRSKWQTFTFAKRFSSIWSVIWLMVFYIPFYDIGYNIFQLKFILYSHYPLQCVHFKRKCWRFDSIQLLTNVLFNDISI